MTRAQAKVLAAKIKYASYTVAVNLIWQELELIKKPVEKTSEDTKASYTWKLKKKV